MTNSDRKCRQVQEAVCGDSADVLYSQEVKEHIAGCPECRKFAEALNRPALVSAPSAEVMNRATALMRDDLRPVRPLASRLTYAIALAAVLCFAFGFASFSMRPYGWEEMGALKTALVVAALGVCAAACVWSLVKLMAPAGRYTVGPELLPALVVGAIAIGTAASFHFELEDEFWATSWVCLKIGLGVAMPTAALVWLVIRRGTVLAPGVTGATAGVLAGLIGAAALEVHCPNLDAWHILVSHVGVAVCAGSVGWAVGTIVAARPFRKSRPA